MYKGAANRLEAELRESATLAVQSPSYRPYPTQSSTHFSSYTSITASASPNSDFVIPMPESADIGSANPSQDPQQTRRPEEVIAVENQPQQSTNKYLLTCINAFGSPELEHISLNQPNINDEVLFRYIREAYIIHRRAERPFHSKTPKIVRRFVRSVDRCLNGCERIFIKGLKILELDWLVSWIGDSFFMIPSFVSCVKVSHRTTFCYISQTKCQQYSLNLFLEARDVSHSCLGYHCLQRITC